MACKLPTVLSLILVGFAASSAMGQTVNIDYGPYSWDLPAGEYAGAGSPGAWNVAYGEHGVPRALYRVDGASIPATVTLLDGAGGLAWSVDDPATTYGDEALLDDCAHGGTDVVGRIRFDDLENDTYDVIVYAWTPGAPDVFTSVWPDCDFLSESYSIGGPWPGALEEGVTHARYTATVTDGTLVICTAGGIAWDGAINGIQLVGSDCVHDGPDLCTLPPNAGPCDGICPRFFHNPCTGHCEEFTWGCCKGNANNFPTMEECLAACPGSSPGCQSSSPPREDPSTPDQGYGTKNRYLSFSAGDAGRSQAIQVTFQSLPGFEYGQGRVVWVQEPYPVTEASGTTGPAPPPTFWVAQLGCDPLYMDWSGFGVVDVVGDAIVPDATFEVRVIDVNCEPATPEYYSIPLDVTMSEVGDVVGGCSVSPPCVEGPQGVVDFIDILAILDRFKGTPGSIRKARADIIGDGPNDALTNGKVDFVDISYAIDAFRAEAVSLPGPPVDDPCAGP